MKYYKPYTMAYIYTYFLYSSFKSNYALLHFSGEEAIGIQNISYCFVTGSRDVGPLSLGNAVQPYPITPCTSVSSTCVCETNTETYRQK